MILALMPAVAFAETQNPMVFDGNVTETLTLTGAFKANGSDGAIWAKNGANVTLSGEGSVHATLGSDNYSMAVWASGAGTKVVINGGSYTNETDNSERGTDLIYASKGATIEINGGTFKAAKTEWTLNCKDNSESQITVKGGSFYKFNPSNPGNIGPEGNKEVVVPDTHKVVQAGDWYTVVPKATGITLDKTSASVEVGKTVSLKATVTPAETLDTVAWTTSDAAVATVKDGVVTAVAPGAATITATVNGKTATFKVSVYKVAEPPKVDNVDTTKPVEEVKPVVKQETVVKATEEAKAVISDIAEGKNTTAVSKETKAKVKAALDAGKTITTEVVVETVKEETVKDDAKKADALLADSNVKKEIGEAKIAQYLNLEIVLKADGQELGTINELSEKMTFTIAVPEELKGKNRVFYVVRVHNGEAEVLPTTMNADGTISFTTDKFSTYALAYADPATTTPTTTPTKDTPKTGDATNMLPWLALMAVAGAGAVVFKKKED